MYVQTMPFKSRTRSIASIAGRTRENLIDLIFFPSFITAIRYLLHFLIFFNLSLSFISFLTNVENLEFFIQSSLIFFQVIRLFQSFLFPFCVTLLPTIYPHSHFSLLILTQFPEHFCQRFFCFCQLFFKFRNRSLLAFFLSFTPQNGSLKLFENGKSFFLCNYCLSFLFTVTFLVHVHKLYCFINTHSCFSSPNMTLA